MSSRYGAQSGTIKYLCYVESVWCTAWNNKISVLFRVGMVHSLEKDNITVLCQSILEAFDGVQYQTARCGVEKLRW
jgi:hypothetical protein